MFWRHSLFDDGMFPRGGLSLFNDIFGDHGRDEMSLAIPSGERWADFVVGEHEPHPSRGQYRSEMTIMTTTTGPDGKPRTTRYAQSSAGDAERQIRQTTQAFSDSHTGKERMALERHIGSQGRRIYTEKDRNTGIENRYENMRGMDETDIPRFDQQWSDHVSQIQADRRRLRGTHNHHRHQIEDRH